MAQTTATKQATVSSYMMIIDYFGDRRPADALNGVTCTPANNLQRMRELAAEAINSGAAHHVNIYDLHDVASDDYQTAAVYTLIATNWGDGWHVKEWMTADDWADKKSRCDVCEAVYRNRDNELIDAGLGSETFDSIAK